MGVISIRSNASLQNTLSNNVIGTFTAEYDTNITDNNVHFTVTMQTTSQALQESTLVCFDDTGSDKGLSVFVRPRSVFCRLY
jgi:hypothetical protein